MFETPDLTRRSVLRLGGTAAAAAGAAGLLAACSGAATGGSTKGTVQYMFWGSTAEQKAVQGMLSSFGKENPNLTVKGLYTPSDYDTKLNALVASDRMPDIAYIQAPMAYRLAQQGRLLNLKPYFDKVPGIGGRLPDAYNFWTEDKTFGTPAAAEVIALFTNPDAFKEAGIDTPPATADAAWNWDAYVQAAYKLTVDNKGRHPDDSGFDPKNIKRWGTLANMWSGTWYGLLLSNGVDIVDESGKKTQLNSAKAVEVLQNLVDLMYKHRVAPTPTQLGNNAPSTPAQLQSGRLGMALDGQWSILDLVAGGKPFGVGVLPSYGTPMTAFMGGAIGISAKTKNVDKVLELYAYQSDPTKVGLFASGLWMPLEKKYYTDDEQIKVWAGNDAHPEGYQTAVIDYTLNHSKRYFAEILRNSEAVNNLLNPAVEQIQGGKVKVQTVMNTLAKKLDDGVLQGYFPNPLVSRS